MPKTTLIGQKFSKLLVASQAESAVYASWSRRRWNCLCDCGKTTTTTTYALTSGKTKSCGCLGRDKASIRGGANHPNWKGGRRISQFGYVKLAKSIIKSIYPDAHINPNNADVFEHVAVMSHHLKRPIVKGESIHHKDGNRQNNDISNLELWTKNQPTGQRVDDVVEWAVDVLSKYAPERLA